MPTLDLQQGPQRLSRYDIVGMLASEQSRFVRHVGLHDEDDRMLRADDEVATVDMRPPLTQGKTFRVHVAGNVPLTNDEIKEIRAWIQEIAEEYRASAAEARRQYIIDPPWQDEKDPNTGVRRHRRYRR